MLCSLIWIWGSSHDFHDFSSIAVRHTISYCLNKEAGHYRCKSMMFTWALKYKILKVESNPQLIFKYGSFNSNMFLTLLLQELCSFLYIWSYAINFFHWSTIAHIQIHYGWKCSFNANLSHSYKMCVQMIFKAFISTCILKIWYFLNIRFFELFIFHFCITK
jgi:hypothetical protein